MSSTLSTTKDNRDLGSSQELMTMKQIATALNVSYDTVNNCVKRIMPYRLQRGKVAYFSEQEVASISKELKNNSSVLSHQTVEVSSTVSNSFTGLELQANFYAASQAYAKYLEAEKLRLEEENKQQKQQLIEQQPKVDFFDDVTGSSDTVDMKEVAKILNVKGVGRNKLFEILRSKKVLDRNNQPYQKCVDLGYFRIIESRYSIPTGEVKINLKTVVFQKGVDFIRSVLKAA